MRPRGLFHSRIDASPERAGRLEPYPFRGATEAFLRADNPLDLLQAETYLTDYRKCVVEGRANCMVPKLLPERLESLERQDRL